MFTTLVQWVEIHWNVFENKPFLIVLEWNELENYLKWHKNRCLKVKCVFFWQLPNACLSRTWQLCLKTEFGSFKGIVLSKIIYSALCRSKPVRISFFCRTQNLKNIRNQIVSGPIVCFPLLWQVTNIQNIFIFTEERNSYMFVTAWRWAFLGELYL